jgi:cytochrome c biogenesis protein CcmG, thiol:disulfide interchange protein DsbE
MDQSQPEDSKPRSRLRLLLQAWTVVVVVALVGLLVNATLNKGEGRHLVSEVKAGGRPLAPEFELPVIWAHAETWPARLGPVLADERVSAQELRGWPIVLNFWASWCVPCKAEAPRLVASARTHTGEVLFLGIDVQDFESDARRFMGRYETNYVSVRDGGDSTYSAYGLTGLPETFYLDRGGRIVAHSVGEVSRSELEENIAKAMG